MSYPLCTIATIRYIESHITSSPLTPHEIQKAVGFSWTHIRMQFRRDTGHPITKYILMRKVHRSALDLLHSDKTILDIALSYGFSTHETYTRAFKRFTGMTPSQFRRGTPAGIYGTSEVETAEQSHDDSIRLPQQEKKLVGKMKLCDGIFSVGIIPTIEQRSNIPMTTPNTNSTILYGVPRAGFGEYGGCTPYPICLKSTLAYLGEDIDYSTTMAITGAAFRFVWNSTDWDLSNVDIYHTFEENNSVYRLPAEAMGREFFFLGRDKTTAKDDFVNFIKSHIDEGCPCIALGIIGPPESCIITGYRETPKGVTGTSEAETKKKSPDNNVTLFGWNFFQNDPEFAGNVSFDECGYFISENWWENTDTQAVMCIGAVTGEQFDETAVIQNGIRALTGRMDCGYYKGTLAYDGWKAALSLSDERNFPKSNSTTVSFEKLLCHTDALNCLSDGRACAARYFTTLSEKSPEKAGLYKKIAEKFTETAATVREIWKKSGKNHDEILTNLANPSVRAQICTLIDKAKSSDEAALELMIEAVK